MKHMDDYIDQDELNFVDDAAIAVMRTILSATKDFKAMHMGDRVAIAKTAFETAHEMLKVRRQYVNDNANLEDEG